MICKCDCGNETIVSKNSLISGRTKSCHHCNTYDLSGEYGVCTVANGKQFYFDLEDYDLIKNYCWYITNDGYVKTTCKLIVHRLVMNCPDNMQIDHINHKKNDNRKSNLRIVTANQNMMNRPKPLNNTSGIVGVRSNKEKSKWVSNIRYNNKLIHLGYFNVFEDAVKVRKEAEEKYFGQYSYDNSMKIK